MMGRCNHVATKIQMQEMDTATGHGLVCPSMGKPCKTRAPTPTRQGPSTSTPKQAAHVRRRAEQRDGGTASRGAGTHTWATTWERKVSMARSTPRKNALNISARFSIISFTLITTGNSEGENKHPIKAAVARCDKVTLCRWIESTDQAHAPQLVLPNQSLAALGQRRLGRHKLELPQHKGVIFFKKNFSRLEDATGHNAHATNDIRHASLPPNKPTGPRHLTNIRFNIRQHT